MAQRLWTPGVRRVSGDVTIWERNGGGLLFQILCHLFEDTRHVGGREDGQVRPRIGSGYLTTSGVARPPKLP